MSDEREVERTEIGPGGERVYPKEWGVPVGSQYSEERVNWVRDNVVELRTRSWHRTADPFLALLQLRRRALAENLSRVRTLIARRRGPQ